MPIERPTIEIGSLLFEGVDQTDLTGPFAVLSRLPGARHRLYASAINPVRDAAGLRLSPDATLDQAPRLDILHVPGGPGQEALMEDAAVLGWLRERAADARFVFSVCTGALLLGAAGLLRGRRATTHWCAHDLLPLFGAVVVAERVVADGRFLFAAGVTAGLDGALTLAGMLCGPEVAQRIQLELAYAPEPPFDSGRLQTAPAAVSAAVREAGAGLRRRREATVRRCQAALGGMTPAA